MIDRSACVGICAAPDAGATGAAARARTPCRGAGAGVGAPGIWRGRGAGRGRRRRDRTARSSTLPESAGAHAVAEVGQRQRADEEHRGAARRSCATGSSRCRWRRTGCPRRRCRTPRPCRRPCRAASAPGRSCRAPPASARRATRVEQTFIRSTPCLDRRAARQRGRAAMICRNSAAFSDAPPTRPPSMSGCASRLAALAASRCRRTGCARARRARVAALQLRAQQRMHLPAPARASPSCRCRSPTPARTRPRSR